MVLRAAHEEPRTGQTYEHIAGSPVGWSQRLGRRIRVDDVTTLGTSTQTLAERALLSGDFVLAMDLADYFHEEMTRANEAVLAWLAQIVNFRLRCRGLDLRVSALEAKAVADSLRTFNAGQGDWIALRTACAQEDAARANVRLESMRVRVASVHDLMVWWVEGLLTDLAHTESELAVLDMVVETNEVLWGPRYSTWQQMSPMERLQLSVESMRGHLSGPSRRGDIRIDESPDWFCMILDPCGSCGVLRRGDPDSGRPPCVMQGTARAHPWAYDRIGLGWYACHAAIVMEWLQVRQGKPPVRPLLDCDQQGPCRWFVYKDPSAAVPHEPSMLSLFNSIRQGSDDR